MLCGGAATSDERRTSDTTTMAAKDLYLPGAASIIDQLDSRLLIVLRDGRNIIGTLRSFDQYLNLVLENTVERIFHEGNFAADPVPFSSQ